MSDGDMNNTPNDHIKDHIKDRLAARLAACIGRLDDAIAQSRGGAVPVMTGMDAEVARIVDDLRAAPVETGHALADRVAAMIGRLEMLEQELVILHAAEKAEGAQNTENGDTP